MTAAGIRRLPRFLGVALALAAARLAAQTPVTITYAGKTSVPGTVDGASADARLSYPSGIVVDQSGNLFVSETYSYTIRKIAPDGSVSTIAGSPNAPGSVDGQGSAARFNGPKALAIDRQGNLYVVDGAATIRKITREGAVTTLAGASGRYGYVDAAGAQARFNYPEGIAVDANGVIYVCDTGNFVVRKITADGEVRTFAGTTYPLGRPPFSQDGFGTSAGFIVPSGIVIDASGNLYVSDFHLIRKITSDGLVVTIAGRNSGGSITDGLGSAAYIDVPQAMALHPSGDIYFVEPYDGLLRKVSPAGQVTTLIRSVPAYGAADGTDQNARFNYPEGLAIDQAGNLFIADTRNYTIRERLLGAAPVFTKTPDSVNVIEGATVKFTAVATGSPTPTYQWQKNGVDLPGATSSSFTIASAAASDAGNYSVTATNLISAVVAPARVLDVQTLPVLTSQPTGQTLAEGRALTLAVTATSNAPLTYRWQKDGVDLAGATSSSLTFSSLVPDNAGTYTAVVTNGAGVRTTAPAVVKVLYSRFTNLAVRSQAGGLSSPLIVGFVVDGLPANVGKSVLIRGIGPGLIQFGVPGAAENPSLLFFDSGRATFGNDDWYVGIDGNAIASLSARLGAFPLSNPSRDAALILNVFAGSYSVWVTGPGNALAEIYDANAGGSGRLVNISARTTVNDSNTLIAGFVITGNTSKRVLIRGVGPGLIPLGVTNALPDPRLTVFQNGFSIYAFNDDWTSDATISAAAAQVGAFALPAGSKDSALLLNLSPGAYSVQVAGAPGATGSALVEVYEVP